MTAPETRLRRARGVADLLDSAFELPVVGDVFDVFWKSNRRNVRLFERHVGAN